MILLPFDYPNTCGECEIRGYGTFCNVVLDDIDVNTKHKDCPIQDAQEVIKCEHCVLMNRVKS